jgi:GH24 family phage-related lysozyme (muramidase)
MSLRERLKARLRTEEGFVAKAYKDSLGHLTIGYGFNLERHDTDRRLQALGLSPTQVRSGTWPITTAQAEDLLDYDALCAITDAGDVVGKEAWPRLPETARLVCADMVYQLGDGGFAGFHKMLEALRTNPPDFIGAAHEMVNSKWAMQTPLRCRQLADLMRSCGAPPLTAA